MLTSDDFTAFFSEVHGYAPFPWQRRLLEHLATAGDWPSLLDLPTGSGKTAVIDIAVFHLALEADRGVERRAPVRIAFVVDRRLIVDDAYGRSNRLAEALAEPKGPITTRVAARLRSFTDDGLPLIARRLRGGLPREDDWARTPAQPTVLCSTVDQVGSRLLFRGYGVSDPMKPIHAGLLGSDCLVLLDEAHLAEPFRQTLDWVRLYGGPRWRETQEAGPWQTALLTATPGPNAGSHFSLDVEDRTHPILGRRLAASKPVRLVVPSNVQSGRQHDSTAADDRVTDLHERTTAVLVEIRRALAHFSDPANGASAPAIGVVVNRVARARSVFDRVRTEFAGEIHGDRMSDPILMIGPARQLDRVELVQALDPIRTRVSGERRQLERPVVVVATQCIEVGVDIDFDAVISEAAPVDALRQRFGRLNRAGREILPFAAAVAMKSDLATRYDDVIYGDAIRVAWDSLNEIAHQQDRDLVVEFGSERSTLPNEPASLTHREDAPILLPAHLDLLCQTSPTPAADPDVSLYLRGPNRAPDSVVVVWRADIEPSMQDSAVRRLLMLLPPRASEAIELPVWAVRSLLSGNGTTAESDLADAPGREATDEHAAAGGRRAFVWYGDDDRSRWTDATGIRPGASVVMPAELGGLDRFGWNPRQTDAVDDLGHTAAEPFAGRRFVVRVAPGLISGVDEDLLADTLAGVVSRRWQDLRDALLELPIPADLQELLRRLDDAKAHSAVTRHLDVYDVDDNWRPRGVVFVAARGLEREPPDHTGSAGTEDDTAGSLIGRAVPLDRHSNDVVSMVTRFAEAAGLSANRVADLILAARLHDLGKTDPRFQAWLQHGDPLGADHDRPEIVLAKSGRRLPTIARQTSGLPEHWRHEALSVRLARANGQSAEANDPGLVLWLIGTHHGHGRPFFPHADPTEAPPEVGPQCLAFEWNGMDWAALFEQLRARYGVWELARMEAVLRLADHRASEISAGDQ